MAANCELYAGPAGTGKTTAVCRRLAEEAVREGDKQFFLIVPEQSAGAYERRMIEEGLRVNDQPGFFNVDIIGFRRLGYRIFEELHLPADRVLEEYEKSILIRAAAGRVKKELGLYGNSLDKVGFTQELKSLFSEFMQFGIEREDLERAASSLEQAGGSDERVQKWKDILRIYEAFRSMSARSEDGSLAEERDRMLGKLLAGNTPLKLTDGAVFVFDDFRGFTPDQFRILQGLAQRAERMIFTLTIEPGLLDPSDPVPPYDRFHQSYETWRRLTQHCGELKIRPFLRSEETRAYRAPEIGHIEEFGFSFPGKEYAGEDTGAFEVWQCEDPEEELRVILEDISAGVRKGARFRDYAVIAGNAEELHSFSEREFRLYRTPVFMDIRRKGENNPFTDALMRLLLIAERDYDYESVFGFLKTGVLQPEEPDDFLVLENAALLTGIRGRRLWGKEGFFSDPAAERGRRVFMQTVGEGLKRLSEAHTASAHAEAVLALLESEGLDFSGKTAALADEMWEQDRMADYLIYSSFYGKLRQLIEKTGRVLGGEEMDAPEFRDILLAGIRDMRLGVIPPTLDAVLLGDPSRTRPENVDTLYIMEMNEGILPSGRRLQPILNETDRRLLSKELESMGKYLAPDDEMRSAEEMLSLYRMMARPAKRLVLLYSRQDRMGKEREKSNLISRFLRLFKDRKIEEKRAQGGVSRQADAPRFSGWLKGCLEHGGEGDHTRLVNYLRNPKTMQQVRESLLPALNYENKGAELSQDVMKNLPISLSVSQLERYAACPYFYFLQYILGLRERRVHAFDQLDVGNLIHRTMELCGREMHELFGNDWNGQTDSQLKQMADRNLEKALQEDGRAGSETADGKMENDRRELQLLAEQSIVGLREHIRAGSLLPEYFEQAFTAAFSVKRPDGTPMEIRINGKIDRTDMREEGNRIYVRIMDYKTGNKEFVPQEIMTGTSVQLPVYSDIVCHILEDEFPGKEIIPAGMYYVRLDKPVMEAPGPNAIKAANGDAVEAARTLLRKQLRLRGLMNDSPEAENAADRFRVLELQEKNTVTADRKLVSGMVLPLDVKDGVPDEKAAMTETEGVQDCMGFAGVRMRELAEEILSGKMKKTPVKYAGSDPACRYCAYRSVCRNNMHNVTEREIKAPAGNVREQLDLMLPLGDVKYSSAGFLNRQPGDK